MNSKKLKELETLMADGDVDIVPKGWYTRQEMATAFKRSQVQSDKIISKMVKNGAFKKKFFRIKTLAGIRSIPHFRF